METPGHTLYIRNIDSKVHPTRVRLLLYTAFSQFGSVLDVVCSRRQKVRGQAWVIFSQVASATEAKKKMEGKLLLGKPIEIHFAANKSHVIARLDGTYKRTSPSASSPNEAPTALGPSKKRNDSGDPKDSETQSKRHRAEESEVQGEEVKHKVLFCDGLPDNCPALALETLFKQYKGFEQVRMVESRGIAFVDFDDEENAALAKKGLDGFKLDDSHLLKLSFAKK